MNYYNNCSKILQDLCKQIGNATGMPKNIPAPKAVNAPADDLLIDTDNFGANAIGAGLAMNLNLNTKKAKVLFDYEATDPAEISVFANQVNSNIGKINLLKYLINIINLDNKYTNIAQ